MSRHSEGLLSVAIVGRPNVGKSTLFNRLSGKRLAIVHDEPGVTRDRRMGDGKLGDLRFRIIDTAGFEQGKTGSLEARMRAQTEAALVEADVILMLVDARAGILPEDDFFARIIRKAGKPVALLANKAEGGAGAQGLAESYKLGLGDPIGFSAEHGDGTEALYSRLREASETIIGDVYRDFEDEEEKEAFDPETPFVDDPEKPIRIAVLGRPNAGKSTLLNALLGEDRLLTGPEAGITRDSISVEWTWYDETNDFKPRPIMLWDTAGMRKRARVQENLERLSVADGLRAVKFSEVVILLIDATRAFDKQDIQLADLIEREGRAIIIAINKWDLKLDREAIRKTVQDTLLRTLPRMRGVPILMLSGLTGKGLDKLMPAVLKQYALWNTRISTGRLNRWLADAIDRHPPPADSGRPVKLRYMTQAKSRPPTFVAFSSRGNSVPESYERYLANGLREKFGLDGVPIRIFIRKGRNPYDE